jgi:hypothetical protein
LKRRRIKRATAPNISMNLTEEAKRVKQELRRKEMKDDNASYKRAGGWSVVYSRRK